MDEDITMGDGDEPSYPAPEHTTASTPYPLQPLPLESPSSRPAWPSGKWSGDHATSMADTARGYLSLAQYFELANNPPKQKQNSKKDPSPKPQDDAESGEDDDDGDAEGEEGGNEGGDEEGDQDEAGDERAQADDQTSLKAAMRPPPAPVQEDIWTTLPGVHHLPDQDYLEVPRQGAFTQPLISSDTNGNASGIRGRGRGRPRKNRGRGGWKWALKNTEHEGIFDTRITAEAAGTRKRGRGGRQGRGRARAQLNRATTSTNWNEFRYADPGEEFKELQAKATAAFLESNLDGALEYALQAVTKNPEVPAAHFLIDQVLTAQGDTDRAWKAAWTGAFASRTPGAWMAVGERALDSLEGAPEEKHKELYEKALGCFSSALKYDKNSLEVRERKMETYIEMKAYRSAFRECKSMLKIKPGDTDNLWKYAELFKLCKNIRKEAKASREERAPRVIEAYRAAFHAWRAEPTFGDANMQWAHLDMYIGILEDVGTPPADCIRELKQLARWFLGRGHEIFWDSLGDDCEYDTTPERRMRTSFFSARMFSLDEPRYGQGLPLWLRAKLGCLRARMGFLYRDEAVRHFNSLLAHPSAAEDNVETFMTTAERLSALYWYHDALNFYEAAKDVEKMDGHRFFLGMGRCYRQLERNDDAEKGFKAALGADEESMDARIELARLYAKAGRAEEAATIAQEISRLGRESIYRNEAAVLSRKSKLLPRRKPTKKALASKDGGTDRSGSVAKAVQTPERDNIEPEQQGAEDEEVDHEDDDANDGSSEDESHATGSQRHESAQPAKKPVRKYKKKGVVPYDEEMVKLREQRDRVQDSHRMVVELWPFLEDEKNEEAVRQWMDHAEAMAAEFKSVKAFYPGLPTDRFAGLLAGRNAETRHLIAEMDSLRKQMRKVNMEEDADDSEAVPSSDDKTIGDFHGVSFQEWHRILSDLTLQYARFADEENCMGMISSLSRANVFRHDFALFNTTLALSLYCATAFNDRELFLDTARQYLFQTDYRSGMAYQIFAASGSIGYGDSPFDLDGSKMQQWTSRLVKQHDSLIMTPEMREQWEWPSFETSKEPRYQRLGKVDDGLIPGLLVTYAHIVTSKRRVHSSSALAYLFRALALQPEEIVINLSLATNYILDGMRRADFDSAGLDRQQTIQQGLGFFYRYYNARVATGKVCHLQEAEYNAARIWDLMGWTHMAAKGYDKVLKLSGQVQDEAEREGEEVEDFAPEAAYALQKIFVAAGNEDAARAVGEEWLTL